MAHLIKSGEIYKIYNKWFMEASGPGGRSLNIPMSYFLRDSFRYPSDKVGE
jgi:glutamate/aspartate transport system substrate-binding protein